MKLRKNMRLGNKVFLILSILFITNKHTFSEEKIISTPLLNIEEIKPSFEELEEESENITQNKKFKEKKGEKNLKSSQAVMIGLDKITAKSSEFIVNLNESPYFGRTLQLSDSKTEEEIYQGETFRVEKFSIKGKVEVFDPFTQGR